MESLKILYDLRHPPANSKYTIQIWYGGHFETKNGFKEYIGEQMICIDNLDKKICCLTVVKALALDLGYRKTYQVFLKGSGNNYDVVYQSDTRDVSLSSQLTKTIGELRGNRELVMYIDGCREDVAHEQYPSILSWNCQGVKNSTIEMLAMLVHVYDPTIVFLTETRLSSSAIGKMAHSLGYPNFRACPANKYIENLHNNDNRHKNADNSDKCVGLAVFWKSSVNLDLSDNTGNYLDFMVKVPNDNERWRFIAFYGHPNDKILSQKWLQKLLIESVTSAHVVVGDFNSITTSEDKIGGNPPKHNDIKKFNDCLAACGLDFIPSIGYRFTWTGHSGIKERLDMAMASEAWKLLFRNHKVLHLSDQTISDHVPILLETNIKKQKPLQIDAIGTKMRRLITFAALLEQSFILVRRLDECSSSTPGGYPEYYFDILQNVVPHLFQVKYVAIKTKMKVTCERQITLNVYNHFHQLVWNCLVTPKLSQENYDPEIKYDIPSISKDVEVVRCNLSEYLAQACDLIKVFSNYDRIPKEVIVNLKIRTQVENFSIWYEEVSAFGCGYSNILAKLRNDASLAERAVILFNTMISLFKNLEIESQGAQRKLDVINIISAYEKYIYNEILESDTEKDFNIIDTHTEDKEYCFYYYENKSDSSFISTDIIEVFNFLHNTLEWRRFENDFKYDFSDMNAKNLSDALEQKMLKLNEHVMLAIGSKCWIELIDSGIKIENLANFADKTTIEGQFDLLEEIGCISEENGEFALTNKLNIIVNRFQEASDEAFKQLKTSRKPMSFSNYKDNLKKAYKPSETPGKRKKG